jgi:peptidoglycan/LPS O-acetylase OafA/YrhL
MPPAREAFAPIHYRMRFPALDGLRALPVTMVFAFHYGGGAASGPLLHNVSIMRLQGWSALNLFFTLSGFLITGVLYDTRHDSHFFKRFYARRVLRIFPVYYLLASVLLALTAVFHYEWRPQHLLFLVYVGNFVAAFMPSLYQVHARFPAANLYIGHLWTLCVEEQFYLLWPLLVWSIRDRVKLMWTAAGLSLIAVVLRVWLVYGVGSDLHGGWLLTMLPFHLDGLLIGGILALLMRGGAVERWQRRAPWMFVAGVVGLGIGFVLDIYGWVPTVGFPLTALTSAGLIGWALMPGSLAGRVLGLRPLRVFGRCSYGFYVYHLPFAAAWAALARVVGQRIHSPHWGYVMVMASNYVISFLVAKVSYEYFESRFMRKKRLFEYDDEKAAKSSRTYNDA